MGLSPHLGDEAQYPSIVIPAKAGIHGVKSAPNRRTPWIPGSGRSKSPEGDA